MGNILRGYGNDEITKFFNILMLLDKLSKPISQWGFNH